MRTHSLKVWPLHFEQLVCGDKTFEFRKNDRDFQVGDTLDLQEYRPEDGAFTGRRTSRLVKHMLTEGFGLPSGYVVMSIAIPAPQANSVEDHFEALAKQIEEAERPVSGGPWCDGYEPIENRDYFAKMVRNFAKNLPAHQTQVIGELVEYFERQIDWSRDTFGPALRTKGVIDHIRKELKEIEQNPHDLSEWVDVVILAMDGFWRHGGKASDLLPALLAKQQKNMARTWPDWRCMSEDMRDRA